METKTMRSIFVLAFGIISMMFSATCAFAESPQSFNYEKKVGSRTLLVKLSKLKQSKDTLFTYSMDEFVDKARKIQKENLSFIVQTGSSSAPWHNQKKFYQEKKALIVQSQDVFLSYKIPLNLQTMKISIGGVLTDSGQFVAESITSRVDLLKYITPNDISDIFDKLGMFRFTRPLVYDKKHNTEIKGWDELEYDVMWSDKNEADFQRVISLMP
jgi:hypothetical protein